MRYLTSHSFMDDTQHTTDMRDFWITLALIAFFVGWLFITAMLDFT